MSHMSPCCCWFLLILWFICESVTCVYVWRHCSERVAKLKSSELKSQFVNCYLLFGAQGQKFGENPRIHSRKDSHQQNYENLIVNISVYHAMLYCENGFLQKSTGRIRMDSRTRSWISILGFMFGFESEDWIIDNETEVLSMSECMTIIDPPS